MRHQRAASFICSVLALLTFVITAPLSAQATGRIAGRIIDAEFGSPIAGAVVEVVGTALRTQAAIDGRYSLSNVPSGPASVRVRFIGYQPKVVAGIAVPEGGAVEQNVSLSAQAVELEEITVAAAEEKGTVNRALEEQRNAVNIVSSISAEQIERSPDSDAGQAVQRVSGVTVQDGKFVFVRGLGERYTTTSLNGSRIPSPEPERRVVPLDLFPAGLLEGITTSKTFTPEQSGDFSGAEVNLKTREFPAQRLFKVAVSTGYNSRATGSDIVKAPTVGREWLGYAGSARDLPAEVRAAGSLTSLPQQTQNQLLGSFRNAWSARDGSGAPSGSTSIALGGEDGVFGQRIGYLGSFSYGYSQEVRAEESRATVVRSSSGTGTEVYSNYSGETGRSSVLWGGMLNLSTRIGTGSKIGFNNNYNRSADNEGTLLSGQHRDWGALQATRLTFVERSVLSSQLNGEHLLGQRHQISWTGNFSEINRNEPDRSDLLYEPGTDGAGNPVLRWSTAPQAAVRTFSDLQENSYEGRLNYRMLLNSNATASIKVGGLARKTDRDADSRAYNIEQINLTDDERELRPEQIFSGDFAAASRLRLTPNQNGGRYTAAERLSAGYIQVELPLVNRLSMVGGARLEHDQLDVNTRQAFGVGTVGADLNTTDVLPSLAFNYTLSPTQTLRASASQTLSRPEYRELAPVRYFDILGNLPISGNANLERTLIQNFDLRWEWYPNSGETVSLALFAKHFDRPIEKVFTFVAGGEPELTFANATSARNYGIEAELRKGLAVLSPSLRNFAFFANLTVMRSNVTPGDDSLSRATSSERPMVGQSDYVANTGLSFTSPNGGVSLTALYNVVGRRISEAAPRPLPDTYEEARHLIDVSAQFQPWPSWSIRLDAKNLLDAPYRFTQGEVMRLRYKTGRGFAIGFGWTP